MNPVPTCECCGEPTGWVLLDLKYEHVCGVCAEEWGLAGMCEYTNQYRVIMSCVGCGRKGPVNHNRFTYFCGGGPRCIP